MAERDDINPAWLLRRALLRQGPSLAFMLFATALIILLLPEDFVSTYLPISQRIFAASLILYGVTVQMFLYLQGRMRTPSSEFEQDSVQYELRRLRKQLAFRPDSSLETMKEQIQALREEISRKSSQQLELDESERSSLVEGVSDKIQEALGDEFLRVVDERYGTAVMERSYVSELLSDFSAVRSRLLEEVSALQRRANSNLSIGSITTLLAMGSLAYVVLGASDSFPNMTSLLTYYVPRVSFAVFIEVFAFFFLRLYKANLLDVKFYQNELTNVESRVIALKAAIFEKREADLTDILQALAHTERNFVLRKGETTVDLERSRVSSEGEQTTIQQLSRPMKKLRQALIDEES